MRFLLSALLVLAFPASAFAALEETPLVKIGGVRSDCVQPTGPEGEVLVATKTGPRLLAASREGLKPADTPVFTNPDAAECPAASTAASGAGVIACCQYAYGATAAIREPGGTWGMPSELAKDDGGPVRALETAVSERGDAIVLFTRALGNELRLSAVRRTPGAAFGAPELVAGPFRLTPDVTVPVLDSFQAVMTADGETVVMYELPEDVHARPRRNTVDVMVVTAPAGGRFGAPQRLGVMPRLSHAWLAVAPDGHALVSLTDATSIRAAARAPGQRFSAPVRVASLADPVGARTRVALDATGRAAIAWSGIAFGGVAAATRAPSGVFATPVALAPAVRRLPVEVALVMDGGLSYDVPAGGWYFGGAGIQTGVDASGAWVSWESPQAIGGFRYNAAALATLPFDGSPATTQTVGGRTADAREVTRLTLTDGAPTLMWLDDQSRLHLATEGVQTATTSLPEVEVGRPLKTALTSRDKLRLPVRCSGPCELRGQLLGDSDTDASLTLEHGGKGTLVIDSFSSFIAPRRPGRVRLRLTYGPLGGARVTTRTLALRLSQQRPRSQNVPTVHALRAIRHGNRIDVSWTTDVRVMSFFDLHGTKTRSRFELPVAHTWLAGNKRRRRFRATLPAAGVRYVTLIGWGTAPGKLVVPVH